MDDYFGSVQRWFQGIDGEFYHARASLGSGVQHRAGGTPFIVARTVVNFSRALVVKDSDLEALRGAGKLKHLEPLSEVLLAKIRACAMDSTTLKLDFADILLDQELVD